MLYSGDRETEGFIHSAIAKRVPAELLDELVASGLLDVTRDGFGLHDFGEHNSAEKTDVQTRREQWRIRQANRRERLKNKALAVTSELETVTVTRDVTLASRQEEDKDKDKEEDKDSDSGIESPTDSLLSLVGQATEEGSSPVAVFVDLWNLYRTDTKVPSITVPLSPKRRDKILTVLKATFPEWPGDQSRVRDAVEAFTSDPFNGGENDRHNTYGVDTFLRHADKWRDKSATPA